MLGERRSTDEAAWDSPDSTAYGSASDYRSKSAAAHTFSTSFAATATCNTPAPAAAGGTATAHRAALPSNASTAREHALLDGRRRPAV